MHLVVSDTKHDSVTQNLLSCDIFIIIPKWQLSKCSNVFLESFTRILSMQVKLISLERGWQYFSKASITVFNILLLLRCKLECAKHLMCLSSNDCQEHRHLHLSILFFQLRRDRVALLPPSPFLPILGGVAIMDVEAGRDRKRVCLTPYSAHQFYSRDV